MVNDKKSKRNIMTGQLRWLMRNLHLSKKFQNFMLLNLQAHLDCLKRCWQISFQVILMMNGTQRDVKPCYAPISLVKYAGQEGINVLYSSWTVATKTYCSDIGLKPVANFLQTNKVVAGKFDELEVELNANLCWSLNIVWESSRHFGIHYRMIRFQCSISR